MYFRFVYSCSFKNMNAEMETLSLLLVSTAPRVLWLPYSLYAGYVITGKEEKEEESWIHRYTHLPLSTSFFLLFVPYSPSYTANLCISHACRLQVSSHWGNMSYLTLFIDSTVQASACTLLQTHAHV